MPRSDEKLAALEDSTVRDVRASFGEIFGVPIRGLLQGYVRVIWGLHRGYLAVSQQGKPNIDTNIV